MDMVFWNLFSDDYRRNCLAWRHSCRNPVIPAGGQTWKRYWTANPDVLEFAGRRLLYYRGNGTMPGTDGERHDRIAVAEIAGITADGIAIRDLNGGLPIIDVGGAEAFDGGHVLDPAAVVFRDKVWLYYSAVGPGPDSVGLACSSDGIRFEKMGKVIEGRAPDIVVKDRRIFMLFQKANREGRYEFFLASSEDGIHFGMEAAAPVFTPAGNRGWDGHDIVTGRLLSLDNGFQLLYGGSSSLIDQPDYFGLARSRDLVHWERHPGNPVFGCGPKGAEDGGAIWFPALIETSDTFVLLYEGSRGNYGGDVSSQICMATIRKTAHGCNEGEPRGTTL